jgi:hypothetical protein
MRPARRPAVGAAVREGRTERVVLEREDVRPVRVAHGKSVDGAGSPSSTVVIISRGCPSSQPAWPDPPAQSPSCVCASSASGPTTATRIGSADGQRRGPPSGSIPSFSSSTSERRATSRLRSECAAAHHGVQPGRRQTGVLEEAEVELSVRMRATAASNASG